jgi:voltage-gated potassium channel
MDAHRRFVVLFALIVGVLVVGTMGYMLTEDHSFLDALYMTVITISTVGLGYVGRQDLQPEGKIFTIFLIFCGIGIVAYAFETLTTMVVEGTLRDVLRRRRMEKKLDRIQDHYVVCGLGQTGRSIVREIQAAGLPYVVVDKDEECLRDLSRSEDFLFVQGDATEEATLERCRLEAARGLFAALNSDVGNLYIVITARDRWPDLRIVARATKESEMHKMQRAGADAVVTPNEIGGARMGIVMLNPGVVTFLDVLTENLGQQLRLEEVHICENSDLADKSLREAALPQRTGLIVIALRSGQQDRYVFNPGSAAVLGVGDRLIVLGSADQVAQLKTLACEAVGAG